VLEAGQDLPLAQEPFAGTPGTEAGVQPLDGDPLHEAGIVAHAGEHGPHPTMAEHAHDPVRADALGSGLGMGGHLQLLERRWGLEERARGLLRLQQVLDLLAHLGVEAAAARCARRSAGASSSTSSSTRSTSPQRRSRPSSMAFPLAGTETDPIGGQ
jgi:hypothetical protein